ncbi:MAG: hypothetical protein AB7O59_03225 [Pirellulales bacterium]
MRSTRAAADPLRRGTRWLLWTLVLTLVLVSPALAAKKKKEEAAAAPKKSYVVSYVIVIMVVGLGLMAAVRPSTRADKPKERIHDDEA